MVEETIHMFEFILNIQIKKNPCSNGMDGKSINEHGGLYTSLWF